MKIFSILLIILFCLGCGQQGGQVSTGTITFTVSPMESSDYSGVGPMGGLNPRMGHAFPTDHGFFSFRENVYPPSYNVYVPANGTITAITFTESDWPEDSGQTGTYKDWMITIEHAVDFKSKFGHMASLEASILSQAGELQPNVENIVSIAVSAGDQLGLCGGRPEVVYNLDWYIIDQSLSLDFINPDRYGRMKNAAHFLDYCSDELQMQYTPMFYNPAADPIVTRETQPLGGQICFDQVGKLSGNWFHNSITAEEAAITEYNKQLAFVYEEYDPALLRVTFGGPEGDIGGSDISSPLGLYVTSYQVVGNTPDPSQVDVSSGEVIYHIKGLEINNETTIEGTLLVNIVGNVIVSVEGFTGYVTSPAFSANVQTYIR